MPDESDEGRTGEFVQSLDRGLAVIRAFGTRHEPLTLSEVAREAGISRASARRFLHTLIELGYVGSDGREFHLRPRLLELGFAYLSTLSLPDLAAPHLRALSDATGESSSVAVLDGESIVYVARVAVRRLMAAAIGVGTRLPAYATSMGRAILGCGDIALREDYLSHTALEPLTDRTIVAPEALRDELDRVRSQGWSLVDQELELGLRSMAAPIRDATGSVVAAVNVATPARRSDASDADADVLRHLQDAAMSIERDLVQARVRLR